jgi:hypothetical protein
MAWNWKTTTEQGKKKEYKDFQTSPHFRDSIGPDMAPLLWKKFPFGFATTHGTMFPQWTNNAFLAFANCLYKNYEKTATKQVNKHLLKKHLIQAVESFFANSTVALKQYFE